MSDRADELVRELGLAPHPEGGFYREIFRSRRMVRTDDGRSERWAATSIYYLLRGSDTNRWHRVASDEIWHWHEGAPLELHLLDAQVARHKVEPMGPVGGALAPMRVVPAGCWQAVRCTGDFTLAGCIVAPGFEFSDFRLMRDVPEMAARLAQAFPDLSAFL